MNVVLKRDIMLTCGFQRSRVHVSIMKTSTTKIVNTISCADLFHGTTEVKVTVIQHNYRLTCHCGPELGRYRADAASIDPISDNFWPIITLLHKYWYHVSSRSPFAFLHSFLSLSHSHSLSPPPPPPSISLSLFLDLSYNPSESIFVSTHSSTHPPIYLSINLIISF